MRASPPFFILSRTDNRLFAVLDTLEGSSSTEGSLFLHRLHRTAVGLPLEVGVFFLLSCAFGQISVRHFYVSLDKYVLAGGFSGGSRVLLGKMSCVGMLFSLYGHFVTNRLYLRIRKISLHLRAVGFFGYVMASAVRLTSR